MTGQLIKYRKYVYIAFFRILSALASFMVALAVSRFLSAEQAGVYFTYNAVLLVLVTVSCLGLQDVFVRYVSAFSAGREWARVNGVIKLGLLSSLACSSFLSIILIFFGGVFHNQLSNNDALGNILVVVGVTLVPFTLLQLFGSALQGRKNYLKSVIYKNLTVHLIFLIGLLLTTLFGHKLTAVTCALLFLISSIIACIAAYFSWYHRSETLIQADLSVLKDLKKSAVPLWIASVMVVFIEWFGTIVASFYVSPDKVALLAVSQRIALTTSFFLIVINLVAAPKFSENFKLGNLSELRRLSLICSRLMLLFAIPITFFLLVASEDVLALFGSEYISAAPLLKVLVVGQFVNICSGSVGLLLIMSGNETFVRSAILMSGILNIILTFALIPYFGVFGAALAISISVIFQNVLMIFGVKRHLGFNMLNLIRQ